jgi:hypothetical protein
VRLPITEINQDPIAYVHRDEAAEALHIVGHALLVGGDDLAEVFRAVEPTRSENITAT